MTRDEPLYISPKELATRWRCARSSVDRVARKNHFTRLCLGDGKNAAVRYLWKEVEMFETNRRVRMS
jgi:hypothetical protein